MSNIPNMSIIYTVDLCGNRYTSGFLDGIYVCFLLGLGACIAIFMQHIRSKEETAPIVINVYTNKDEEECCDCDCDCEDEDCGCTHEEQEEQEEEEDGEAEEVEEEEQEEAEAEQPVQQPVEETTQTEETTVAE